MPAGWTFSGTSSKPRRNIVNEYHDCIQRTKRSGEKAQRSRGTFGHLWNNGQCQDLRDGYGLTRDLYRDAWNQENRPYWLDNLMANYDLSMQLWIKRGRRFNEIEQQWSRTGKLPKPEDIGLPSTPAASTVGSVSARLIPGAFRGADSIDGQILRL